jgi:hypothetical protein
MPARVVLPHVSESTVRRADRHALVSPTVRVRLNLFALPLAAVALLCVAPPARAEKHELSTPVPELEALAATATQLLNAHLSPGFSQPMRIGWDTGTPKEPGPAFTSWGGGYKFVFAGHVLYTKDDACEIALVKPRFEALTAGHPNWAEEIVTHELFHCYEMQIAGVGGWEHMKEWVREGLDRWVDVTLFASEPIAISLGSVKKYFESSTVPLFARDYDAVGFWGHLQDIAGDVWQRIPAILRAGAEGNQQAVHAALSGVPLEKFFDTWGSSAANRPEGGASWTPVSPLPDNPFAAPTHTLTPSGPDTTVSTPLDAYSTNQLAIPIPSAPSGDIETMRIALGGAYGRFGVMDNYTGKTLEYMTFCGECSVGALKPVTASCAPYEVSVPPPPLTHLPADALLGVAAAGTDATVTVTYAAVPLVEVTESTCQLATGNKASTGGDPHLVDFHGDLYDFQGRGEYTLLESTTEDMQIQVFQQPFLHSHTVSVNGKVAIRDGGATVEVDSTGPSSAVVYINRHRAARGHRSLAGGGSVTITADGAELRWADGTTAKVTAYITTHTLLSFSPDLDISIHVTPDRYGHLAGLLGDAGVAPAQEFASRGGTFYPPAEVIGEDPTALEGAFGRSWRVPNVRASLFRSTTPADLKAIVFPGSLQHDLDKFFKLHLGKAQAAERTCTRRHIDGATFPACELDVAETGDTGFAGGDVVLQQTATSDEREERTVSGPTGTGTAVTTAPASTTPTATPVPTVAAQAIDPINLGAGSTPPAIAYDPATGDTYVAWLTDDSGPIEVCTIVSGANSCNGGAGPDQLSDQLAAGGVYTDPRVILDDGAVVVLDEIYGAAKAGYEGSGVVAWSSAAGGAGFAAVGGGLANKGKFLAASAGDMPDNGATELGATGQIAAYGNDTLGNGFMDFSLTDPAPTGTDPAVDQAVGDSYDDQLSTTGSQIAAVPDGAGKYLVVLVGGDAYSDSSCAEQSTGYGAALGTPGELQKQKAWRSEYFKQIACGAIAPVLSGGSAGVGVLEDEGSAGSESVDYRMFDAATMTFGAPVALSAEGGAALDGADELSASQDATGGVYAAWADERGILFDYSADGGSNWSAPVVSGIEGGEDPVVQGLGAGSAELAYTDSDAEELLPVTAAGS